VAVELVATGLLVALLSALVAGEELALVALASEAVPVTEAEDWSADVVPVPTLAEVVVPDPAPVVVVPEEV
jgi:hypothetical protein